MTQLARSALCCALVIATLSAAGNAAAARAVAAPAPQALLLPAELSNVCEADPQALQLAMARHWRPSLNALDQWTQLVRSFACDLSGQRDLGWHRVPLRARLCHRSRVLSMTRRLVRAWRPLRSFTAEPRSRPRDGRSTEVHFSAVSCCMAREWRRSGSW